MIEMIIFENKDVSVIKINLCCCILNFLIVTIIIILIGFLINPISPHLISRFPTIILQIHFNLTIVIHRQFHHNPILIQIILFLYS